MREHIMFTERRDIREHNRIGPVAVHEADDQNAAILSLRDQAVALGANVVAGLTFSEVLADPHFRHYRVSAFGVAARLDQKSLKNIKQS